MDTQLYRISINDLAGVLSAELCFYIIDAVYMTPLAKLLSVVRSEPSRAVDLYADNGKHGANMDIQRG